MLTGAVTKSMWAKARAFDNITMKKFLVMTNISSKINVSWSDILFGIIYAMVKGDNQSQGYDVQIHYLLSHMQPKLVEDISSHGLKSV